jgi:hypothetical protein
MFSLKAATLVATAISLGACVLPIPTTLHARGHVLDAATKKPVAGAHVTVKDHSKATPVTANDGSFGIPSETHWGLIVPPQEPVGLADTLVITKTGYGSKIAKTSDTEILLHRD